MSRVFHVRDRYFRKLRMSLETCRDGVPSMNNERVARIVRRVNFFSLVVGLEVMTSRFTHY